MANGKIRFGKQSGVELALVFTDGVTNTEVVVTEDEVVKYSYKQVFTTETNEEKLEKVKTQMLVKIYQDYLDDTDHKFYGDYEPKVGEDLEPIRAKRSEARAFVRANKEEV